MKRVVSKPVVVAVTLVVLLSMALVSAGSATTGRTASSGAMNAAAISAGTVAQNARGRMTSRVVGTTGNGRTVTGKFYPLRFSTSDGRVRVRGLVNGVVHNFDGTQSTFSAMRTFRVRSINSVPVRVGRTDVQALATCDILHLVLGPLDLDLLGLQVHLDRVVLDVVARTGAGNLLGNLLCALTGLLDGGLGGLLGRITNLLNQILAALRLGV